MGRALVTAQQAMPEFARWISSSEFAVIDAHPLTGGFGRSYYPAVFELRRRNASFAVLDGSTPLLIAICSVGEGALDWYGMPLSIVAARGLDSVSTGSAVTMAFAEIDRLIESESATLVSVRDTTDGGILSPIGGACLNRGWRAQLAFHGRCNAGAGEPALRQSLRKSFRSLVNWGRRNLVLTYVDAANPDREQFEAYRSFHFSVAGRSTRPEASWQAMFEWIAAGGGELALGHLTTGELVAGTLSVDGTGVTYYASGVYDRERFDKPMAHFPLYDAIIRSGGRGKSCFDLGELPQTGTVSGKEYAIGYFKRGFASEIGVSLTWTRTERPAAVPADDGEGR